ncbi:MAG: phosphate ABC transporter permease PstA [Pseudomonadota bacterium]
MTSTIDFTDLSAKHTSDETKKRLKQRYWAEVRLKAYGMLAIAFAGAALLLLTSTIVTKTTSVVYEYYVTLEAQIEVSDRDQERLADPNPRLRANLRRVVGASLQETVPGEVGRAEQRALAGLLSGEAGLELGDLVKADPSLIGQTISFDALLDDNTQLYLKGSYGRPEVINSSGTLTLTPVEGEDGVVEAKVGPSALTEVFEALRDQRLTEAQRARAEQRRQQNAVEVWEQRLLDAETEEERSELESRLESSRFQRDTAARKADDLMQKATVLREITFEMGNRDPSLFLRAGAGWIKATAVAREYVRGEFYEPIEGASFPEGEWSALMMMSPEIERPIDDRQVVWLEDFSDRGLIVEKFNSRILTVSDSASAELAGIWGALVGSFWTMMVTFLLAFPLGVMASIYLEEFAPKNRTTDLIEVNINNLAAVPSIVFGLLGLAIFVAGIDVHIFGYEIQIGGFLPRSSPLAGGAVLALMTLPTIIIAGRASIRAVPPSIRDAALGLGASKLQTATHHVLPLAMPGILTGSIIGMAQALGETAPLLLVGMNSFIQEPPGDPLSPGNVLPTLIYQWNSNSERLFDDKTAAAISVLLIFLVIMNALAVLLRKRFERRW